MMDSTGLIGGQYDTRFVDERLSPERIGAGLETHPDIAAIMATLVASRSLAGPAQGILGRTGSWKWIGRLDRFRC